MKKQFAMIDIHVNYFAEGNFWVVSALSHINPGQGDDDPEEFGSMETFKDEGMAVRYARSYAKVNEDRANRVTVFINGNSDTTSSA